MAGNIDIDDLLLKELKFFDGSQALKNFNSAILREIDAKQRISVTKIVFSRGLYHKFIITARS